MLAPDMFAILRIIEGEALDPIGALARLATEHDIEAEEAPLAIVEARLRELTALGLADEVR